MIYRNDDVCYDADIKQYKKIQDILGEYGIKECYSVIPVGRTIFLPKANIRPREKVEMIVGDNPVNTDKEADKFIRDSLKDGHSISLHGYKHINFSRVSYDEQYDMIKEGKRFLEEEYNTEVKYFVPPFNSYNKYTVLICKRLGLEILGANDNQLEWLVRDGKDFTDDEYCWYHAWRFKNKEKKLKLWLEKHLTKE